MNAADLVTLRTAADWFPHRGGQKPSLDSLTKWVETGRSGVFLKATSSGGQWFTCREWVEEFLAASDAPPKPARKRTR
jgi:hypothetical protein